jgi:formate dehydrogenase major subunit
MQMLMDLGWDGDLTDDERAAIDAVAGPEDQLEDRPVGRHPAGGHQAWLRALRQRQGPCRGVDLPRSGAVHREPLYTNRRDLVADYPTYEDRKFYRLPTMYASIQKNDFSKDYPIILTSGRLVEYEGGGDETRSNPWLAELAAGHVRRNQPA